MLSSVFVCFCSFFFFFFFFFFNDTATTEIYTLSLHDALPIWATVGPYFDDVVFEARSRFCFSTRSEEHTSELQSLAYLVCRLLLEKKKKTKTPHIFDHLLNSVTTLPTY